jgi:diadenylate cyclase
MTTIHKAILDFGCRIAKEVEAKALLLYADAAKELTICPDAEPGFLIVVAAKTGEVPELPCGPCTLLTVPNVNLTRMGQIKIAVTKGIAAGLFRKGDKIVCITGIPRFGYVDSIVVIDVGREFEILTSEHFNDLTEDVEPEIFGAVLNLALELAAQGREGRKVGTIFILGDHEKVLQLSRQMIINPFMGYSEGQLNILNPELKETIKEFSAIDGAFIIRGDGTLMTAGRHLSAALDSREFPQGLGSRHIAGAGMTSLTRATAIVISESSGSVSVFKDGKIFVTIEKPTE